MTTVTGNYRKPMSDRIVDILKQTEGFKELCKKSLTT